MKRYVQRSKGNDSGWQVFSKRTLHNNPLRIISQMCRNTFAIPGLQTATSKCHQRQDRIGGI